MLRKLSWMAVACAVTGCGAEPEKGDAGPKGMNSLVRLEPVAPGDKCANGGTAIHTGLDLNDNGTLDADETVDTSWVCSGVTGGAGATGETGPSGKPALVLLVPEAPGDNCANGGTSVLSGVDEDGDGELGEDEITSRVFLCDGVASRIDGDVVVDTALVLSLLQGVKEITGDLTVQGVDGAFALPRLEKVGGDILIDANATLTSISLPSLEETTNVLIVITSDALTEIDLSSLRNVTESFVISGDAKITTFALPALESVGLNLTISDVKELESLDLPELASVGGVLEISSNDALDSIQLGQLQSVSELEVLTNKALETLRLDALSTVTDAVYIDANIALTTLHLNALTKTAKIQVSNNAELVDLQAAALTDVSAEFAIRQNQKLSQCIVDGILGQLANEPPVKKTNGNKQTGDCA